MLSKLKYLKCVIHTETRQQESKTTKKSAPYFLFFYGFISGFLFVCCDECKSPVKQNGRQLENVPGIIYY